MIEQEVKEVLAEMLCVEKSTVINTATIQNDLGADSLDTIELIMALEEKFDIDISDDEACEVKTVQDAIDLVEKIKATK